MDLRKRGAPMAILRCAYGGAAFRFLLTQTRWTAPASSIKGIETQLPPIEFAEITADNALLQILPAKKTASRAHFDPQRGAALIGQNQPAYFRAN